MIQTTRVLIDTCVWVPFFNRAPSQEKQAIRRLLISDRAVLIGPVLAEILHGFRKSAHADWVESQLRGAIYIEASWHDWKRAAVQGRELASKGHRLPLTDLIIAAMALRLGYAVFTIDPHFDLIQGLNRFETH